MVNVHHRGRPPSRHLDPRGNMHSRWWQEADDSDNLRVTLSETNPDQHQLHLPPRRPIRQVARPNTASDGQNCSSRDPMDIDRPMCRYFRNATAGKRAGGPLEVQLAERPSASLRHAMPGFLRPGNTAQRRCRPAESQPAATRNHQSSARHRSPTPSLTGGPSDRRTLPLHCLSLSRLSIQRQAPQPDTGCSEHGDRLPGHHPAMQRPSIGHPADPRMLPQRPLMRRQRPRRQSTRTPRGTPTTLDATPRTTPHDRRAGRQRTLCVTHRAPPLRHRHATPEARQRTPTPRPTKRRAAGDENCHLLDDRPYTRDPPHATSPSRNKTTTTPRVATTTGSRRSRRRKPNS